LHIRNRLLASLSADDLAQLGPHLSEIRTQQGDLLEEPGRPLDAVYFPQSGMISLIVQMPEDTAVEVGTVGLEGAIGMAVGLGSRSSFVSALVQVSGTAFRHGIFKPPRISVLGYVNLSSCMQSSSLVKFNRLRLVMPCTKCPSD
jgi:hypothetical protein